MPAAARRRRYPSDTTAAEWALIEPLLPVPACETKRGGHPEKWPRRQIVDAIRYIVDNGAKWRALPADFCEMLWRLRLTHPQITQVWADSAYALPARHLGRRLSPPHPEDRLPTARRERVRGPAPPLESRKNAGLDHACPPQREGLREASAALGIAPDLGPDHRDDPAPDPQRSSPRLDAKADALSQLGLVRPIGAYHLTC